MEALRGTRAGTKLVALIGGASFVVIIGLAAVVSSRPDLQLLFTNLDDHDVGKVGKALADAGYTFRTTSPPAPFNVYVDESEHASAMASVYSAGALDKPLVGITSASGVASVFNSADERRQGVRKREWQEMEAMLRSLRFITSAHVRTSPGTSNAFARHAPRTTASVTLETSNPLTRPQMDTVARIVSNGLGVERRDVVISDHELAVIFDGSDANDDGFDGQDAREFESEHDRRLSERANQVLEVALGPGKAHVIVTSEWNYEQSTSRIESANGKGVLLEETKHSTERPQTGARSGVGGVVGVSANTAIDPATVVATENTAPPEPPVERITDETKKYSPLTTTEERVSAIPVIKRLSVAFYVDETDLDPAKFDSLESSVKASVGFDEARDTFESSSLTFFVPATPVVDPAAAAPTEPNPMLETMLRRGVEIVTALVFIALLIKTLRNSSKGSKKDVVVPQSHEEVDAEMLARASVDELLKSDPDRVGEILSSWARGEEALVKS
jgi:flagellar M-ring protein FliF